MGNIGSTILVPGVYVTVDNSLANTALGGSFKTVLFGQSLPTGAANEEELVQVFSANDAAEKFGVGSILANMFTEWFKNNSANEVYAVALADAVGSTKSVRSFSGTETVQRPADGVMYAEINDRTYQVAFSEGETLLSVRQSLEAVINADVTSPYTADSSVANKMLFTAKNAGTVQNDAHIDNYEVYSTGRLLFFEDAPVLGAVDPDINDAIAALPDEVIKLIVNPYVDATSLAALKAELDRRWENTIQVDGHSIMAFGGTPSEVITKGLALNSEHFSFMDSGKETHVPPYLVAAEVAGRAAFSLDADPALPLRTLPISGMIGDSATNRRTFGEKNSILNAGISTHNVQNDGTCVIDRMITTYKTNGVGAKDTSYQNTNTMFNLSFMRQSFKNRMLSKYPRHKLADDGMRFGAGQPIATPSGIKGEIIALYNEWINLGLAEDVDAFADTLTVERDSVNRSRVNVVMQPILIGQLYQFDATLQFIV